MEFLPRAKFRELVFLIIFGLDHVDQEIDNLIDSLYDQVKVSKRHLKDAAKVAINILPYISKIDAQIAALSVEYAVERVMKVELNILRLAIYELMQQEVPAICVISEALRLARKFSTLESSKYINAILDQYVKGQMVS